MSTATAPERAIVTGGRARRRQRIAPSAVIWLLVGATYFLLPLIATLLFSLRGDLTGKCCTLDSYGTILDDPQFVKALRQSFILSLETIAISLALLIPTVYWVHLKLPRLRTVIGFLALVPFVVPPIVLVVGLLDVLRPTPDWFYAQPYGFLVGAYVILAFPYVYFSLDAGFRAIDVHTLTEASQSLGATWWTTLFRVILPNIRVAALGGAFLTLAIVMGEFTIAVLGAFDTFPVYIQYINQTKTYPAAAVSLMRFGITWAAMLALVLVARRTGGQAVAGAH
jgi:putative spermidine/putrescine transport system permease protein